MIKIIEINSSFNLSTENNSIIIISPEFTLSIETDKSKSYEEELSEDNNFEWRHRQHFTQEENDFIRTWVENNIERILSETLNGYKNYCRNMTEYDDYEEFTAPSIEATDEDDGKENVALKENFKQVCVWPGCVVNDDAKDGFEEILLEKMGVRTQFLEMIKTLPDVQDRKEENPETGGRSDTFFAVHEEDVGKFAVPRLSLGIRWIEDATSEANGYPSNPIYPPRVLKYKTW